MFIVAEFTVPEPRLFLGVNDKLLLVCLDTTKKILSSKLSIELKTSVYAGPRDPKNHIF